MARGSKVTGKPVHIVNVDGEEIVVKENRWKTTADVFLGDGDVVPPPQGARVRISGEGVVQGFALKPILDQGALKGWVGIVTVKLEEGSLRQVRTPSPPRLPGTEPRTERDKDAAGVVDLAARTAKRRTSPPRKPTGGRRRR